MSPARARRPAVDHPRPELGPAPRITVPSVAERTLESGLRVAAARRPGVPLVEVRLRVPFAGTTVTHLAPSALLGQTLFSGTAEHDARSLAEAIQSLGGGLSAGSDADRLAVAGSALAPRLGRLLALLAEVLVSNTYPADEVTGERDRMAEEIAIARTTPATLASEAVARRVFGHHPYGRGLPTVEQVQGVTAAALRRLHAARVSPTGALLVIVGDIRPAKALDAAESALAGWSSDGRRAVTLPRVPAFTPGGVALLDRPGAVQTCVRLAAPAARRTDADYAALVAVNTVFAGYFSSRLVANIREDKGYTYSPHSGIDHSQQASILTIDADVATEVTAPSLMEMQYEMGRVATLPVQQAELDAARRYLIGTLALSTASQAGLASTLARLLDAGLEPSWLREHPAALAEVSVASAHEAAHRWLAPSAAATVLVGDAQRIAADVETLAAVTPMALE